MVGRTARITKADRARFERIKAMPCTCCTQLGIDQPSMTTAHHLLSGGRRRGHQFVIPLCEWHHYARPIVVTRSSIEGHTDEWMTEKYGPSLLIASKRFHEAFGTDNELLAKVNRFLEGAAYDAA